MKLLFVHDHHFIEQNSNIYSDKLPYSYFERHLKFFDEVLVWGRRKKEIQSNGISNTSLTSGANVSYYLAESISSLKSYLSYRRKIRKVLTTKIKSSDRVVVRLPSEYGLMAIDIAKKLKKPIACEVVACVWDSLWYYGGMKPKIYAPLAYLKMKRAVNQCPYVLYVTDNFLQKRYPANKKAKTVSVSDVDLAIIDEQVLEKRIKKILSKKDFITFGTIGSFKSKYKGIHLAIQALSKNREELGNFRYKILGDGNTSPLLKLAKKYELHNELNFDGTLPSGAPVFSWLDGIDIYLHPSLVEGMPRSVIEGMSRGCPIIASNVGGIPDLLNNEVIHKRGDISGLASKISMIYEDKSLQIKNAQENFNKSKEFSHSLLDKKWMKFLNEFSAG